MDIAVRLTEEEWDDLAICFAAGRRGEVVNARQASSSDLADKHLARARRITVLSAKFDQARQEQNG